MEARIEAVEEELPRKSRRMQLSNKFVCPQVCILVKAASQQFHRVVAMARKPRPHLPVALVMV